jgi:hypothetical protein
VITSKHEACIQLAACGDGNFLLSWCMYVLIETQLAACKEVGLHVTVWGKPQTKMASHDPV